MGVRASRIATRDSVRGGGARDDDLRARRADRPDHARPARARQRDHARDAARARRLRRARQPRPRGPRDRARRQRHRLLRRLRPRGSAEACRLERRGASSRTMAHRSIPRSSPPTTIPSATWDPVTDFQMMSRNVRGFMSLFHSEKPVVCKVHGYCVAGGTDMALCSDLLVVAEDAKIGYPPARVWGVPTTALWALQARPDAGQATAADRRLDLRARGGRAGASRPTGRRRPSSTARSSRCSSGSRGCRSTSS